LDRQINDMFGWSVALSESTLVVGALFEFGGSAGINGVPGRQEQAAIRCSLHLRAIDSRGSRGLRRDVV
jgi:hypothetical protein